jgi:3-methyladenine DNA glycosylase AlkC
MKDVGRLALRDIKDNEAKVEKIFKYLDANKIELAKKHIIAVLSTPNYFIRELVGKKLVEYQDGEKMDEVVLSLMGHKTYGVKAATVFYFFIKNFDDPQKILSILEMSWIETPWETEHILQQMWVKYPDIMKTEMLVWATSEHERQRALAYHGCEEAAADDPNFVTRLIEVNLDDESLEVQKKLSNVLTAALRSKPAETYPYVREWLTNPSEHRMKSLVLAMKKIITIAQQSLANGKINKNDDFYVLTMHAINDWKIDPDEKVASIGHKLVSFAKKPSDED